MGWISGESEATDRHVYAYSEVQACTLARYQTYCNYCQRGLPLSNSTQELTCFSQAINLFMRTVVIKFSHQFRIVMIYGCVKDIINTSF